MIERWVPKLRKERCGDGLTLRMWTDRDGDYVLYTDHLAAIEEKDKEIERLRKALQLIASEGGKSRETECGIIQCNGAWCADQAYWAIQEDSDG